MRKFLFMFFLFLVPLLMAGCYTKSGTISIDRNTGMVSYDVGTNNSDTSSDVQKNQKETIYVSIYGEVINPGVYVLTKGTRVFEAINRAGGLTECADVTGLNLVASLEKDSQILVPKTTTDGGTKGSAGNGANWKININTASAEELTTLSGIGPSKAADIVSYREKYGDFKSIEALKKVPGIGDATYERICGNITVD